MRQLGHLGFRSRFTISFLLILTIVFIGGIFLFYQASLITGLVSHVRDAAMPRALIADDMALQAVQVQQWLTDVSATGNPDGYADAREAADFFRAGLRKLRSSYRLETSGAVREMRRGELEQLEREFDSFYALGLRMAAAYLERGRAAGNVLMIDFDGRTEALTQQMRTIRERNVQIVRDELEGATQFSAWVRIIVVLQTLLTVAASLLVGFLLTRSIMRPVDDMQAGLRGILDQNNLSRRIENSSRTEIGNIADWLNLFVENIAFFVIQIQNYLVFITRASTQLDASALRVAEISQTQAASSEEASAALEELSSSSDAISESVAGQSGQIRSIDGNMRELNEALQQVNITAEDMYALASESADRALGGQGTMRAGMESMERIRGQAARISEIVAIINGISDKTNLLALNASIEAARAGEAGRGFAVVASEISNLAEHTAQSVREIEELVVQTGQEVERGSEEVGKTADVLRKITDDTSGVRERAASVRDSLKEQGERTKEIGESISSVARSAGEIEIAAIEQKGTALETSRTMMELSEQTQRLATDSTGLRRIGGEIATVAVALEELADLYSLDSDHASLFSFNRVMRSGDRVRDDEHRHYFALANRLFACIRDDSAERGEELSAIVHELESYFAAHLPAEEAAMRKAEYPDFAAHQASHRGVTAWLAEYRERMERDLAGADVSPERVRLLALELMTRMGTWLGSHILREDRRFTEWKPSAPVS
ncbi:MAG: methyl-accepting chemotaxis protein [bacterium]|nr:methyl-accepting chemotaxis protein [bacterium]